MIKKLDHLGFDTKIAKDGTDFRVVLWGFGNFVDELGLVII